MVRWLLFAVLFLALAMAEIWPGDIPLNDDWSYGEGVRHFLKTGQFYMPNVLAGGFPHVILGAAFCKILGFSYAHLRLASLSMAWLGAFAFYKTAILVGGSRRKAFWFTLVYALNPILINVCFSFMSDATCLAVSALFIYLALLAVKKDSIPALCGASLALALATLVRQPAVLLGAIFLPQMVLAKSPKLGRFYPLLALIPSGLAIRFAEEWLKQRAARGELITPVFVQVQEAHHNFFAGFLSHFLPRIILSNEALFQSLCYLALFCLPLLPMLGGGCLRKIIEKRVSKTSVLTVSLVSFALIALAFHGTVVVKGATMPFSENIWRVTSIGAQAIMGICHPMISHHRRFYLTIASYTAAYALVGLAFWYLLAMVRRRKAVIPLSLIAVTAITIAFVAVETAIRFTDRYYLIALMPILLCLLSLSSYLRVKPGLLTRVMIILFCVYSACGCQDYLAGNRARYRAIAKVEQQGVTFKDIDGGAEYNLQHNQSICDGPYHGEPPRDKWRWWAINGEKYIVSFSPIPDYDVLFQQNFFSWLSWRRETVYMLKAVETKP